MTGPEGGENVRFKKPKGGRRLVIAHGGIQQSDVRDFIFSIWDNAAHSAPIRTVFRGHGTTTEGFGGEGTGLKSMNTRLPWQSDTWYTLATRCWPAGPGHTYYGYWYRDGVSGKWRHLVTMDVAAANSTYGGGNTSFLEDWTSSGQNRRETNLRGGWKRLGNGTWQAATVARYSLNGNDIVPGGSATKPTTAQPASFTIPRPETRPTYPAASVLSLEGIPSGGRLILSWKLDSLALPQFGHVIEIFDNASAYRVFSLKDGAITVSTLGRGMGKAALRGGRSGRILLPGVSAAGLPALSGTDRLMGADGRSRGASAAGLYLIAP